MGVYAVSDDDDDVALKEPAEEPIDEEKAKPADGLTGNFLGCLGRLVVFHDLHRLGGPSDFPGEAGLLGDVAQRLTVGGPHSLVHGRIGQLSPVALCQEFVALLTHLGCAL